MVSLWRLGVLFLLLAVAGNVLATTHYIAANGSDSNSGTSKTSPWLHAPGMMGCSANCATIDNGSGNAGNAQPGDQFILRGGDTWGPSSLPWTWRSKGNSSTQIYIGVDKTWFSGTSWTRPILDLQSANGGPAFVWGGGGQAQYVTLDNIEFKGLIQTSASNGSTYMEIHSNTGLIIQNLYMHAWSHQSPAGDGCKLIVGDTNDSNDTLTNSVFDGSDSTNGGDSCYAVYNAFLDGTIAYNVFHNLANMYVGEARYVHDNLFWKLNPDFDVTAHLNMFENNASRNAIFWNNVYNGGSNAGSNVTFWDQPGGTSPSYYFNNVVLNSTTANVWDIVQSGPSGGRMFNNTLECGPDSSPNAACTGNTTYNFHNNHFVTGNTALTGFSSQSNNLTQTKSSANSAGYTYTNGFTPQSAGAPTVAQGVNLTSICNSLAIPSAVNACKLSTTFACTYDQTNHIPVCPGITTVARPASGPWDIGAFQYSTSQGSQPSPPGNLQAQVR